MSVLDGVAVLRVGEDVVFAFLDEEIEVPTIFLLDRVMARRVLGDVQSEQQLVSVPVPSRDRSRLRRVMRFASAGQYEAYCALAPLPLLSLPGEHVEVRRAHGGRRGGAGVTVGHAGAHVRHVPDVRKHGMVAGVKSLLDTGCDGVRAQEESCEEELHEQFSLQELAEKKRGPQEVLCIRTLLFSLVMS